MKPVLRHPWTLSVQEAVALQREWARRVIPAGPRPMAPYRVAGLDISGSGRWSRRDEQLFAGVVVLQIPGGRIVEYHSLVRPSPFPYVPGLLSFREIPLYAELLEKVSIRPDLILCDGQGLAHPRRFGLASHLGVLFEVPTVGVAKSRLCGVHREPGPARGCRTRLREGGETIGKVLRTRSNVKPLFVSTGHRIGLEEAVRTVLSLAHRYRLPEPTRLADQWVGRLRRGIREVPTPETLRGR